MVGLKLDEVIDGVFLQRVSRFSAYVLVNEKKELSFLPNPGRMQELLRPYAKILLRKKQAKTRKTAYEIVAAFDDELIVPIDSRTPNLLLKEAFQKGELKELREYKLVKTDFKLGESRYDFLLKDDGERCLVEAKSCTLVKNGVALFPDAPTERGTRHILGLLEAKRMNYSCFIIFIVQHSAALLFSPNYEVDFRFASTLSVAAREGVNVLAYKLRRPDRSLRLQIDGHIPVQL